MLLSTFIHKFVCEHLFSVLLGIYPRVEFLGHFSSIQYRSVASDSFWLYGLQHARLPCPSPTPGACSRSLCPSCWWCHPSISPYVIPISSHLQYFPASGSLQMSQFFSSGGVSIGVSVWILPVSIQDWVPLGLTDLIFLQSKGLSTGFPNTTAQKHQFFSAQLSL